MNEWMEAIGRCPVKTVDTSCSEGFYWSSWILLRMYLFVCISVFLKSLPLFSFHSSPKSQTRLSSYLKITHGSLNFRIFECNDYLFLIFGCIFLLRQVSWVWLALDVCWLRPTWIVLCWKWINVHSWSKTRLAVIKCINKSRSFYCRHFEIEKSKRYDITICNN